MLSRSVVAVVVSAVAIGGAWFFTQGGDARDPIAQAMAAAPHGSTAISVTAWSRLPEFPDRLLTSRSVGADLDEDLEAQGESVGDLDWDASITTPKGPVVVLSLGSVDGAVVKSLLAETFEIAKHDKTRNVVLASNFQPAIELVDDTIRGAHSSLLSDRAAASVAAKVAGSGAAVFDNGSAKCAVPTDLEGDEISAVQQVEGRFGRLEDPQWMVRALNDQADQYVFAEGFSSPDQARAQQPIREAFTSGRFIGRLGAVEDSLTKPRTSVGGAVVTHTFTPTTDSEPYLVDAGPVLFNGCAVRAE